MVHPARWPGCAATRPPWPERTRLCAMMTELTELRSWGSVALRHAPTRPAGFGYWQPGTPSAEAPVCEPLNAAPTYTPQCELPTL